MLTNRIKALDAADLVLICVPTPVDEQLRPDLQILRDACAEVVRHARPGQTLVLTSTTYVGTTRELLVQPLAERGLRVGEDVFVAFAPERIDPGVTDHEQLQDPARARRQHTGVHASAPPRCCATPASTCTTSPRPEAAELVKLYENTFRAVNIALAFELAEACGTHGLDPIEVTEGAASKPYGFLAHYPSAGVGGHCIAVDPYYLLHDLRERGRPATMAEEALRKVSGRPRHIAWRAHEALVELGRPLPDGARAGRRRLLQARRRRHPRGAGAGDHRPPALRGRPRRLPRPARARRSPSAARSCAGCEAPTRRLRPGDPRDAAPRPRLRLAGALPGRAGLHLPPTRRRTAALPAVSRRSSCD